MGNGCCNAKTARVERTPSGKSQRPVIVNKQPSGRPNVSVFKPYIFLSEESQTTFAELSSPRSGTLIKWQRGELVGKGAYAKVYKCLNINTGELMAVKHFTVITT